MKASTFKPLLLGAVILTVIAACATTTSPTGRKQVVGAVSQAQLNQLGAQAFAETKSKQKLVSSGAQNNEVRCVVNTLVAQLAPEWRSYAWETALFEDKEPNAFALPGGKVGVNTGIFTAAKTQDQLAAVLGHEIGHVIARHHDERITRQQGASTLVSVLGALAGDYGQLATQGGSLLAQTGFLLPGSRAQETEADIIGQQLMAKAGFNPEQAVDLWQNMMAAGGARQPQWLSTHPDPQSRISELRKRALDLQPSYQAARNAGHIPKCG